MKNMITNETDRTHNILVNASKNPTGKFVIMGREVEDEDEGIPPQRWRFARYASQRKKMFANTKKEAKELCKLLDDLTGIHEHKFVRTFNR